MTDAEKIAKFEEIQRSLWDVVLGNTYSNLLVQTMAAQVVRKFQIPGPDGQDPEGA